MMQHHAGQDGAHDFFLSLVKVVDGLEQQGHVVAVAALAFAEDQVVKVRGCG